MKRLDFIHFLEVLQAMRKVDLSSKAAIGATIKKYKDMANKIGGQNYVDILKKYNIDSNEKFEDLFLDENFIEQLENDTVGSKVLSTIILKKRQDMRHEAEYVERKYGQSMSEDINDVEDYYNTYVLREKDGNGPVVFVELHNYKDINRIKTWYAYRYGVNYMKVSPCSFEFWIEHPDRQEFSNREMVRAKRNGELDEIWNNEFDPDFDDLESLNDYDDELMEDVTDVPSFSKGDMVEDEKGQGYVVIATLTSDAEVERAKKKRPYRVILPKNYEISDETPVVAVMTIKATKRGLNYIYPISKFTAIGNDTL